MADWTRSMEQTFEYYTVDATSWKDMARIDNVLSCSISRDSTDSKLASATLTLSEEMDECYIRAYMVVVQDGIRERFCLGTYLAQRTDVSFNGSYPEVSFDAYSPLQELSEKSPELGFSLAKGDNVLESAYLRVRENMRAPIVRPYSETVLDEEFIANLDDDELTFCTDLIAQAGYHFDLDERSRVIIAPDTLLASMQPAWTYTDDNSSILQPDVTLTKDLYDIPNVVEVIYQGTSRTLTGIAENTDPNSPVGIPRRGRRVVKRITDPAFSGEPLQAEIDEYAQTQLDELSTLTAQISYTHGFNEVRVGDCVLIDYKAAGLSNTKARVVSQDFECESGVQVSETAEYLIHF